MLNDFFYCIALACGIIWGVGTLILGLLAWKFHIAVEIVKLISSGYIGYAANLKGSLIGGVEGFIDGFIGGYILSWIYNKIQKTCTI